MGVVPANCPNPALYRARWVLPVHQPPIADGAIIVRGLSIDAVGPFADIKDTLPENAHVDLGEVVIFPGLINAHTHLDNSVLANIEMPAEGMVTWVEAHQQAMAEFSEKEIRSAYLQQLDGLADLGTLAIADITYLSREKLPQADQPLWSLSFFEVRGFDRQRAEVNLERASKEFEHAWTTVSGVWNRFGISAHGPHSLNREVLQTIAERCLRRGDVFTLHCAESQEELEFMKSGSGPFAEGIKRWGFWDDEWKAPGMSSVKYLDSLGVLDANTMAVHCVHLDDDDLDIFTRSGATACLCPRSNENMNTGTARAAEMKERNIPMVLGTDGLGSAQTLSMFDEMAACARIHPGLSPDDILAMATLNPARTLRIDSIMGSFEMNKLGRFLVYNGETGSNPAEAIVNGPDMAKIEWAGGDIDMRP